MGYDNYTYTSLGAGWTFDFPWLGTNYVHLSGGQVYPYNWTTGKTFINHQGENFNLTKKQDGSYDLYLANGMLYHFGSGLKLNNVTDATKNNTITFSYVGNSLTKINDTALRIVNLAYANG